MIDCDEHWTEIAKRLEERELLDQITSVARDHRVTVFEVCNRRRTRTVTQARHACWRYLRHQIGFSYPEIAAIWNVDHTSIIQGCKDKKT